MQDDTTEHNPGRVEFWQSFYAEGGRLESKEWGHRRSAELRENGSLKDHYEWFMLYPAYEEPLTNCLLRRLLRTVPPHTREGQPLRVLHVGCGNSDLCDHLSATVPNLCRRPEFSAASPALGCALRRLGTDAAEVLNVDICEDLLIHLATRFPQRQYGVGNCCDMVHELPLRAAPSSCCCRGDWFSYKDRGRDAADERAGAKYSLRLAGVAPGSVDMVCDKGTLDALMSAFAGEYNPNVEAYANEMLSALRPGGVMFLISINAEDVVCSYLLAAQDGRDPGKGFQLAQRVEVELPSEELKLLRVETLGSRYNCYTFQVVCD